jgi:hypothetical protein
MVGGLGLIGWGAAREEGSWQFLFVGLGVLFALSGLGAFLVWRHDRKRGA